MPKSIRSLCVSIRIVVASVVMVLRPDEWRERASRCARCIGVLPPGAHSGHGGQVWADELDRPGEASR